MTLNSTHQSAEDWDICIIPDAARSLRILVVDDDPSDRELYRYLLAADPKYTYVLLETGLGKKAIEICKTERFDCVLLDYYLSDLNGVQILDSLNTLFSGSVPIIMLTGQGSETIAVDSLRSGAVDYLPKRQVSAESLKRAVNNAVEKSYLRNAVVDQNDKLKRQNTELTRKHDEIQRFYQTVSHELKTPLTSMKEFVSIILDGIAGPISDEQREYLELVHESCLQMANDVNDLLDVTRLETGKYRIDLSPTDPTDLLSNVYRQMQVLARDKSIDLSLKTPQKLPEIPMDQRRIEQVLTNLLSNAIKFTNKQGKIEISACAQQDESVEISVSDTGCGIDPDDLKHIFERLYQVSSESGFESMASSKSGLGLGLTISKELINLHGGELRAESEVGKGSRFIVSLPAYWNTAKAS